MTTQNNTIVNVKVESRASLIQDALYIINKNYFDVTKGSHVGPLQMEGANIIYPTLSGTWYWGTFEDVSTATLKEFVNGFWKASPRLSKYHLVEEFLFANTKVSGEVWGRITLAERVERALNECNAMVPFNGGMYLHFEDEDQPTIILEYPTSEVTSSLASHIRNTKDHEVSLRETLAF